MKVLWAPKSKHTLVSALLVAPPTTALAVGIAPLLISSPPDSMVDIIGAALVLLFFLESLLSPGQKSACCQLRHTYYLVVQSEEA